MNMTIINCGGLIRRKSDEIDRTPVIGILRKDGTIKPKPLNTDIDRFHETPPKQEESAIDIRAFVAGIEQLSEDAVNFKEAVRQAIIDSGVKPKTREIIEKILKSA